MSIIFLQPGQSNRLANTGAGPITNVRISSTKLEILQHRSRFWSMFFQEPRESLSKLSENLKLRAEAIIGLHVSFNQRFGAVEHVYVPNITDFLRIPLLIYQIQWM